MKTVVDNTGLDQTDRDFELPVATASARRRGRFALVAAVVLMPLVFLGCFKACQAVLGNQALASVSDDGYDPAALFGDADTARAAKILHDKVMRDPRRVAALDRQQILMLFSRPDLRRSEGPYRHWQYVSDSCVLDLYMKIGSGEPAHPVQYVDFRPRHKAYYHQPDTADPATSDDIIDRQACLSSLTQRRMVHASLADLQ